MEKMNGESMNIERENIKRLKEIFPEVFTEDKIDFEKLQLILGEDIEESEERYSFNWNGKRDAIRLSQTPTTGTLRPDKNNSKNWDETENLYIEGDNLEVLKLLQKSYHGKIKMIYIDPPYNTGKDFVYKDNYRDNMKNYLEFTEQVDEEGHKLSTNTDTSGRYHTDWLNMMYPRLRLARNLLTDDGVIFISIDDNEVHNLRKICDEVFGEDNFVGENIVIIKTEGRRYGFFAKTNDNFLVYSKNNRKANLNKISIKGKTFKYKDSYGGFNLQDLRNQNARAFNSTNRPNLRYPFYVDESNSKENELLVVYIAQNDDKSLTEVWPIITNGYKSVWRWGREKSEKEINKNLVARKGSDGTIRIFQKMRNIKELPKSVWIGKEFLSNKGTREVAELLGEGIFDFPKPIGFVKTIVEIGSNKDSIILDFFSGSSTTAHAVMDLNAEDGGNRKFIMVQLPEPTDEKSEAYKEGYKTIADIGRERIRRAGDKILEDLKTKYEKASEEERKNMKNPDDLDIGFKSFKLDSSNIKEWNPEYMEKDFTMEELVNNFVPDREKEDILYEIILKYGIDLTTPIEQHKVGDKIIYNIGFGSLFVCLENNIDNDVVDKILKLNEEYKMPNPMVVFKDTGFKNDEIKLNAKLSLNDNGIEEVVSI